MNSVTHSLSFSINNWEHLYSLQTAILHNRQRSGRSLSIKGRILNHPLFNQQDTAIVIQFLQTDEPPVYATARNQQPLLGLLNYAGQQLSCEIAVDRQVFEELRKNLLEYADIDGIHIMLSLGIICEQETWPENSALELVQLDYAMKGDA